MAPLIDVQPGPDAAATFLGHYGVSNPTVAWLLARHPEMLAYSPTEMRALMHHNTRPPRCCGQAMSYRWDAKGNPVYKCYRHNPPQTRVPTRPKSFIEQRPSGLRSLKRLVKAARDGVIIDLRYDGHRWETIER